MIGGPQTHPRGGFMSFQESWFVVTSPPCPLECSQDGTPFCREEYEEATFTDHWWGPSVPGLGCSRQARMMLSRHCWVLRFPRVTYTTEPWQHMAACWELVGSSRQTEPSCTGGRRLGTSVIRTECPSKRVAFGKVCMPENSCLPRMGVKI